MSEQVQDTENEYLVQIWSIRNFGVKSYFWGKVENVKNYKTFKLNDDKKIRNHNLIIN